MRGWSGNTTGAVARLLAQKGEDFGRACSGSSVLSARCTVATRIAALGEAQPVQHVRAAAPAPRRTSVASYITSPMSWTPATMPSRREIGDRGFGRAQQQRADMVGQHAVDLFRHGDG